LTATAAGRGAFARHAATLQEIIAEKQVLPSVRSPLRSALISFL